MLKRIYIIPLLLMGCWPAPPLAAREVSQTLSQNVSRLNLNQMLTRIAAENPELWKMRQELKIWDSRILQAGLGPNPELSLVNEDFVGPAAFTQDRFTQFTLEISQALILGNKTGYRRELALLHQQLLYWDYRIRLQELAAQARLGYTRLQNHLANQVLLTELTDNAREVYALFDRAVQAGKLAPPALLQAELAIESLKAESWREQLQMQTQQRELAALWGAAEADAIEIQPAPAEPLEALETLQQQLAKNPRLLRWASESQMRQTTLAAAEAQNVPDINLSGGLRYHPPLDWGGMLTLGLPLPLNNQNQGLIAEARQHQQMWALESAHEQQQLQIQLQKAYAQYQGLSHLQDLLSQQEKLVQTQLTTAKISFAAGKSTYLDVLMAQQNLFQLRRQQVQTASDLRLTQVEIWSYTREWLPPAADGQIYPHKLKE